MAKLIACFECGKQVSPEAPKCPHCGGYPHPVQCYLCQEDMKFSEIEVDVLNFSNQALYYHPECIEPVLEEIVYCDNCKNWTSYRAAQDYLYDDSDEPYLRCAECGREFESWKFCELCGFPVIAEAAEHRFKKSAIYGDEGCYFHQYCKPTFWKSFKRFLGWG